MLIEFSVSNFRSFRGKQTLSMVAAPRLRKRDNVFKPQATGETLPDLLKACVIYGPNASGKSNFLRALDVVSSLVLVTPGASQAKLPITPFRFDPALQSEPSTFELHFVQGGMRYQFDLGITAERIVAERLVAYPRGKEALLYERRHVDGSDAYQFGPTLEGGRELHEAWRRLTAPHLLFVSQAVANSNEDLKQLRVPFSWLAHGVVTILDGMESMTRAARQLAKSEVNAVEIASFLRDVDVPVIKLSVEEAAPQAIHKQDAGSLHTAEARSTRVVLTHASALGDAEFSYDDESEGTKNLIGFWLPWCTRLAGSESPGFTLAIDELDTSLHPAVVATLVEMHLKATPPSQLIFTTHDTHLMDTNLLRRDQIWLTERDENGATQMRSVHEFAGREGEDIEKRYFEGRYRALPQLKRA